MIQFLRLHGLALTCTAFPWFAMSCLCKHCHALTCTALLFLALFCLDLHCLALPCTASPWIALPCIDLNFLALTCNTLSWLALPWFVLPCIGWQCFAYIGLHCLAFTCAALPWLTLPCFNLSCSTSLCMYRCKQCRHRQAKARKKTLINAAVVWTLLMQAHIYNCCIDWNQTVRQVDGAIRTHPSHHLNKLQQSILSINCMFRPKNKHYINYNQLYALYSKVQKKFFSTRYVETWGQNAVEI